MRQTCAILLAAAALAGLCQFPTRAESSSDYLSANRTPGGITLEIGGRGLLFHSLVKTVRSGSHAYHRGNLTQAILLFNKALSEDPENYEALYYLGRIARDRKQTDTAAAFFQKAAEANPKAADPHVSLGCLYYFDLKDTDHALDCFARARAIDPEHGLIYYMLGIISHDKGTMASAETYYRQALRLRLDDSTELEIRRIMIQILLEQAAYAEGEEHLLVIEEKFPQQANEPDLRKARGIILIQKERFWEAQQELEAADKDLPKDGDIHFWLGIAFYRRNKLDRATVHFARATVYDSSNGLAHYCLARLYETRDDYEEALRSYDAAQRNGFATDKPEELDNKMIRIKTYLKYWRDDGSPDAHKEE